MSNGENRIYQLLNYAITDSNIFSSNEILSDNIVQVCFKLFSRDNECTFLSNAKGLLCSTYPGQLIIPTKQKYSEKSDSWNDENFVIDKEFQELIIKGRFARTRCRFPTPVLLFRGKFVCRSSTLARSPEIYTRTGFQYLMQGEAATQAENNEKKKTSFSVSNNSYEHQSSNDLHHTNGSSSNIAPMVKKTSTKVQLQSNKHILIQNSVQAVNGNGQNKEWLLDKMRNTDIDILHSLRVNVICDLMVENKKVKYGLNVTSSEKVDRLNRYGDFHLLSIPYPGCEFFADYSNNNYDGVGLKFDWKQNFVDAELQIPNEINGLHKISWKEYMKWDLVTLTQNYLKLLLNSLTLPGTTGILLHCISGWDRTPLFVSLLRLSLWADGLIHQSLNAEEIVYLTLAYDWLLFCHQFSDRIYKSEEIMHFCFEFLKYISTAEYSLLPWLEAKNDSTLATFDTNDYICIDSLQSTTSLGFTINGCYSTNGHATNNECNFEEIYGQGECDNMNGLQLKSLNNQDEALVSLQDIETCVNCLVTNISCSQSGDSSLSGNECIHSKSKCNQWSFCNPTETCNSSGTSSAAILPLSCTENITPQSTTPQHTLLQASSNDFKSSDLCFMQTTNSHQPNLSSSHETSKDETVHAPNSRNRKGAVLETSSSFKANASSNNMDSETCTKSDPIPVPVKSVNGTEANRPNCSGSLSSSLSNPALTFEPGGSWQMISTSPPEMNFATDANSSVSSIARSSQSSSFASPPNCCNSVNDLELKLEKRKEKLKMARNIMIPEYLAVVRKQRQQQQEQSGFSALVGTLVHFVKRV